MRLGDKVEVVTRVTGIKKIVDFFAEKMGVDCGCEKRKEALNNLQIFRKLKPRCITREQFQKLEQVVQDIEGRSTLPIEIARAVAMSYSHVYGTKYEVWCTDCPNKWKHRIKELMNAYEYYQKQINEQTNDDTGSKEARTTKPDSASSTNTKSKKSRGRPKASANAKGRGKVRSGVERAGGDRGEKAVDEQGDKGSEHRGEQRE